MADRLLPWRYLTEGRVYLRGGGGGKEREEPKEEERGFVVGAEREEGEGGEGRGYVRRSVAGSGER